MSLFDWGVNLFAAPQNADSNRQSRDKESSNKAPDMPFLGWGSDLIPRFDVASAPSDSSAAQNRREQGPDSSSNWLSGLPSDIVPRFFADGVTPPATSPAPTKDIVTAAPASKNAQSTDTRQQATNSKGPDEKKPNPALAASASGGGDAPGEEIPEWQVQLCMPNRDMAISRDAEPFVQIPFPSSCACSVCASIFINSSHKHACVSAGGDAVD